MQSRDVLISQILNTPPFQLPPVVHAYGCYSLDIHYLGSRYHKVGISLEECLDGYFRFVTKANHQLKRNDEVLRDLPHPLGAAIYRNEG